MQIQVCMLLEAVGPTLGLLGKIFMKNRKSKQTSVCMARLLICCLRHGACNSRFIQTNLHLNIKSYKLEVVCCQIQWAPNTVCFERFSSRNIKPFSTVFQIYLRLSQVLVSQLVFSKVLFLHFESNETGCFIMQWWQNCKYFEVKFRITLFILNIFYPVFIQHYFFFFSNG